MSNAKVRYRRRRRRAKRGPSSQEHAAEREAYALVDYYAALTDCPYVGKIILGRIAKYGTTDAQVQAYVRHARDMRRREVDRLIAQVTQ